MNYEFESCIYVQLKIYFRFFDKLKNTSSKELEFNSY